MADQHESETLRQQRAARQEFLELKKMQSGEMDTGPKPSEVAIVPKTPMEKWQNFWFHYKWGVLGGIALAVVIAILTVQCATRTRYDLEVALYSYRIVSEDDAEKMAEYLEQYGEDLNGDGEVHIQVINCSFNEKDPNTEYRYSMSTKLQAIMAADANALLYITDKDSYEYLNHLPSDGLLFEGDPLVLGDEFYNFCETEDLASLPEGLQISCRAISDTTISSDKKVGTYYKSSHKILESLR